MLAFTLTAFLELMDHGIVSWDLISLSFIKQVPLLPKLIRHSKVPQRAHCTDLKLQDVSFCSSLFICLFDLSLFLCARNEWVLLPSYSAYYVQLVQCVWTPATQGKTLWEWFTQSLEEGFNGIGVLIGSKWKIPLDWIRNTSFNCFRVISMSADFLLWPHLDCRLREPTNGGCFHPAALSCHPWEHGAQQPQPLPSSGAGDHRGTAHRAPASVSTHTHRGFTRSDMGV